MAREMKDSGIEWIGEIPREWDIIPIKYLCSYNDEVLLEGTAPDFTFDYIEIGSVEYGKGIVDMQHIQFADAPSRARRFVRENDIIVSTVRTYLKAVAAIPYSDKPIVVSTGFVVIRPKNVDPIFLRYAILSDTTISLIESYSVGISYPAINASQVVEFKIPIPKPKEQHAIADFLDNHCSHIDSVIEKTRAAIEEYKKLKQAVITQAVTKGIRPNREMKDSGIEWIGEICEHFQILKLKKCLKHQLQYGANESGVPFDSSLPRYIRITDITIDGKLKSTGALSLPEEVAKDYLLKHNDVLFARSGATVGKAFIYKTAYGKSAFAGYLIKASLNERLLPDLLFYYTQSSIYEEWKNQIFVQATIQNIGADRYKDLPIILPPTDEQAEIASYLDEKTAAIDSLIQKKEQLITELEAYKKSLIYEYVTGKKEVLV